jgi:hypothetical protein
MDHGRIRNKLFYACEIDRIARGWRLLGAVLREGGSGQRYVKSATQAEN